MPGLGMTRHRSTGASDVPRGGMIAERGAQEHRRDIAARDLRALHRGRKVQPRPRHSLRYAAIRRGPKVPLRKLPATARGQHATAEGNAPRDGGEAFHRMTGVTQVTTRVTPPPGALAGTNRETDVRCTRSAHPPGCLTPALTCCFSVGLAVCWLRTSRSHVSRHPGVMSRVIPD